tara:strand:- start:2299 stop:2565 length:267 start_codon:yes stop_codon:yes gene_type:complete
MEVKNYNMAALMGAELTDEDYVKEFGLDPAVANTPTINEVMLAKVEQDNVAFHMEHKMSESEARSRAAQTKADGQKWIKEMLARKGML